MNRSKKIQLAIYLALGFLLLRIGYALIFNGLAGKGVLVALPALTLPRPFSHVRLFGEVSVEGIFRNLEIGFPFALSILAFGVIASFISQAALLSAATKLPWLRNLLTAVALGIAAIPSLLDAAKKVRYANILRGEKRHRMLVPILERSVELANSLGLRVALNTKPKRAAAGINIEDLTIQGLNLPPLSLRVEPGEICILSGETGVGKSSILEVAAGIAHEYRGREWQGRCSIAGLGPNAGLAKLSETVGFVPQNPRELAFGLSVNDIDSELRAQLKFDWGSELAGDRDLETLSEGEVFKLVFSQALARKPSVLVLDEPFDSLDAGSRLRLANRLEEFAAAGNSVLLAEHEPLNLPIANAKRFQLTSDGIAPGVYLPEFARVRRSAPIVGSDRVLELAIAELGFTRPLIEPSNIFLDQGECVWLRGENGAGKTTLLKKIVELAAESSLKPPRQPRVVLVPEHFDDFFVTDSLLAELKRADQIAKVELGFTERNLESILPSAAVSNQSEIHPRDLSRGTRLALAIAMQLSHKPKVLLIDEPFRGLDPAAKELVSETIRCVQETGCAVLFASQDSVWASSLATRILEISAQKLKEVVEVSA